MDWSKSKISKPGSNLTMPAFAETAGTFWGQRKNVSFAFLCFSKKNKTAQLTLSGDLTARDFIWKSTL